MERKFNLTVALISGEVKDFSILITDDKKSVELAFNEKISDIKNFDGDFETFTLYNELGVELFNEETFEGRDNEQIICRWCGRPIESGQDMYVEDSWSFDSYHHCDDCHDILFTKEAWDELYNEFNPIDLDGERTSGDCYYYTTAP